MFTRARNLCPMLVLTFLLNGGFYQSMLFRCLLGRRTCFVVLSVTVSAFAKCFLVWRGGLVNDALSDDNDDSRLLMPAGMFFVVIGG